MKKFLRAICTVLACVLVFSLAGCKNKEEQGKYIAEYNGIKMETGIYVLQMQGAYMEAVQLVENPQEDILKQEIDGKPAKEWIIDKTKEHMAQNFAILSQFDERELTLKEDEINYVNQVTEQQWMYLGASYQQSGLTKDDLLAINTINMKASALFENVYGEGGEKEVPETELKPVYEENYLKVSYLPVYKFAADGTPLEGEELDQTKQLAESYFNRLKNGEDIEVMTAEYQEKLDKEQKALEEKIQAEREAEEKAKVDEALANAEQDTEKEEDNKDKAVVTAEAAEKPAKEDAEAEETEENEETAEAEQQAPTKHTSVFNKTNQQMFDPEFVTNVEDAKVGEKLFFENEQYYLIAQKEDVNEDENDYKEKVLEITLELKSEEFTALIEEWAKDIEPEYDSILTAEHSPKFLNYNNQEEETAEEENAEETTDEPEEVAEETPATDENAETAAEEEATAETESK